MRVFCANRCGEIWVRLGGRWLGMGGLWWGMSWGEVVWCRAGGGAWEVESVLGMIWASLGSTLAHNLHYHVFTTCIGVDEVDRWNVGNGTGHLGEAWGVVEFYWRFVADIFAAMSGQFGASFAEIISLVPKTSKPRSTIHYPAEPPQKKTLITNYVSHNERLCENEAKLVVGKRFWRFFLIFGQKAHLFSPLIFWPLLMLSDNLNCIGTKFKEYG